MAIADRNSSRQYPLVAKVDFTFADFVSGVAQKAVDLPANSRVIGGELNITTAFDSGTTDLLEVGDGDDDDRYVAGAADNGSTVQRIPFDWTTTGPKKYTVSDSIDIKWTGVGAPPTAGAGMLVVMYVLDARTNENHPHRV